jgi:hypothetical protein
MFTNYLEEFIGSWTAKANNTSENDFSIVCWIPEVGEGCHGLMA